MPFVIFVPGRSAPEGSTTAYPAGAHGVRVVHANSELLLPWRAEVRAIARQHLGSSILFPTGAVGLNLDFVLPRRLADPKRSAPPPRTTRPDLDKLLRAVCDALTGVLYHDDAQVTHVVMAKRTAAPEEAPGVWVGWNSPGEPVDRAVVSQGATK